MKKSEVLEIIDRRIDEQCRIMIKYERGAAYDRAAAAKYELVDLKIEVEKIGRKQGRKTP